METNEILKQIHAAAVAKAAEKCRVEGSAKTAIEIGREIVAYGQAWIDAFADDGTITGEEATRINAAFGGLVDKRVPNISNSTVGIAWNGLSFLGIGWKGAKHYINKWFGFAL